MFADLKMLEPTLKMDRKTSKSWRTSPEYYHPIIDGLKPGCMNISFAWFEQGHEVFIYLGRSAIVHQLRLSSPRIISLKCRKISKERTLLASG
jgi:hypothetical protein